MKKSIDKWSARQSHWTDWGHPLRPNAEDVELYRQAIGPISGKNTLQLGHTPELLHFTDTFADLAVNGIDWFKLPFERKFDAIYGDGILLVVGPTIFDAIRPFVNPGGKIIFRTFLSNTSPVLSNHIDIRKFQGHSKAYIPVQELYDTFGDYPTTRDYNGSDEVYYLPNLNELPTPVNILTPSYEYGEFYPVLTWIV